MGRPAISDSRYKWTTASMAFLLWSSWAYLANEESAETLRLISSLMQGTASFLITLIMIHSVTWFYRCISVPGLNLIMPGLITVFITGSCLFFMHALLGTPNILLTITPPLSIALMFCVLTTCKLHFSISGADR